MRVDEFDEVLTRAKREKPFRFAFGLEQASTEQEIAELEALLNLRLPSEYKAFLVRYGAGYLGNINVFSAKPHSEWYLPIRNRLIPQSLGFLAVTDDQTGGYYGFLVQNCQCEDEVYYVHLYDGDPPRPKSRSFLEYVVEVGLSNT